MTMPPLVHARGKTAETLFTFQPIEENNLIGEREKRERGKRERKEREREREREREFQTNLTNN